MSETRPSGLALIPDEKAVVIQEVAEIDKRGRLHLLPRWTMRVRWFHKTPKSGVEALMVFVESGLVSLRDLKEHGFRIEELYSDIATNDDEESLALLRLIQDRYRRFPIDGERRPYIGDAALANLGFPLTRGVKRTVYVAVFPDRIDIVSPEYRNKKLVEGEPRLDDLP